jgi:hypothetical protein
MANIPAGLFERLMAARVGRRALVYIGRLGPDGDVPIETECCPNCGYQLRVRNKEILRALDITQAWFREGMPPGAE